MQYNDEDVFVYQLMDMLVCDYNYKIVNVPGGKRDVWLANDQHERFPMIRLTSAQSTSIVFEKDYISKIKKALSIVIRSDKPLLIINTHKDSSGYVEDDVIQVVAQDHYISDSALVHVFPQIVLKVHRVSNNQNECARLIRNLENNQRQKAKQASKFSWKNAPKASIAISGICLFVFMIISVMARNTGTDNWLANLVVAGGYYKSMIVYGKEYWRLITSIFIHYDLYSILFYGLLLYHLGSQMEKHYGVAKYLLIFLVSAIVGNMCVLTFAQNNVSFGIGGGIFGLVGAFMVYIFETKMFLNPFARLKISQIMMLAVVAMFFAGTDILAFLTGILTGAFVAIILSSHKFFKELKPHFIVCSVACFACLIYGCIASTTAFPEYEELNDRIVEQYKRVGLVKYSKYVDNYLKGAYEE